MRGQGYPNSVREPGSGCRQQEVGIFTFKINSQYLSVEHSVLTIIHLNPISDFPLLDSPINVALFFFYHCSPEDIYPTSTMCSVFIRH